MFQVLSQTHGPEEMKQNALRQDAGQWVVLILTMVAATASLVVIATRSAIAEDRRRSREVRAGGARHLHHRAVLGVHPDDLSRLHYAHDYFLDLAMPGGKPGGPSGRLTFPGDPERLPNYGDFLYFSFTIGMTFQVSDVQICDPSIRRVVLIHGVAAFFYTTGILALSVNLVAGLV